MSEFGSGYASAYDTLYRDKDYGAETDLIASIFQQYGGSGVKRVLDLGCGTGNHSLPLARRGYDVIGVDRSSAMIAQAKAKAGARSRLKLKRGDVRTVRLDESFDAALLMFAVLGYQLSDADVRSTLETARTHLRPGGVLIFDVWFGPAVVAQRPSDRVKVAGRGRERVIRVTSGRINGDNVCTVRYDLWRLKNKRLVSEVHETHRMRYFFPDELRAFLTAAGFEPARLGAFPALDRRPDESSWNAIGVALAR